MIDFLSALGLALVIEGVCYALFPDAMKKMMIQVLSRPSTSLRTVGLSLAVLGVGLIWLMRS